jgi:hypothetical protein
MLGPCSWNLVEEDRIHEGLHVFCHCQLTLESKLNVSEGRDDDLDEEVHDLTFLKERVLIWSS